MKAIAVSVLILIFLIITIAMVQDVGLRNALLIWAATIVTTGAIVWAVYVLCR